MGFFRQKYWSGLPCPPPGDLPDPGMEHTSLMSPALAGGLFTTSATWEALADVYIHQTEKSDSPKSSVTTGRIRMKKTIVLNLGYASILLGFEV